jgi:Fe-S oxidoreductase
MQIFAIVVSLAFTVVAVVAVVAAVRRMLGVMRLGQAATPRTDQPGRRTLTMVKETLLHTRMLQWHWVGIMHWFVYAGFIVLSASVFTAYFQLFDPEFALPIIGHFFLYEWLIEALGLLSTVGIVFLIVYRQLNHPRRLGRKSRFYGSNFWQAYFVEAMALLEGSAILFIRGAEFKLDPDATRFHYPISATFSHLYPDSHATLENIVFFIAMFKIVLAMVWLLVIARNITMGVAWHRFTAWFNIWFKREGSGRTALGALKPLTIDGKAVTLEDIEEDRLDEDAILGVGSIEDFSWKGILDFTTCTECGRCQSQCPAWNTEKPLSPKLMIMGLRDAAYAKAPYLQTPEDQREGLSETLVKEGERPLVGDTGDDWFYMPENGSAVIDPDVLWSCTSCGACVQQCPVDIEHVDHIIDMRRYQILVESNFPAELNGLFKGLENKGNPWNMSPTARMDWAKGLDFEVKVVGDTIESLDEVDWLFWVGCAGAYEDRAKKTTRAVAELLDIAGVSFGVLGNGETCTGDPARRAGNEFVFQGLAQQNAETFKEYKVKKVVSTCAHCFNTLKNEYQEFGVELEVVHHTQLLNRLVREGKLTPVADGAGAHKRSITYHDPCYIGRHNGVYTPPRELLQILPGAEFVEMERNSEKSFCCGAGGARMWMEETLGERINVNRTKEAVGTGADQIAVGCPFCRVMLSDGLTAQQAAGEAREEVEILDVAQMLLSSVKGEMATKLAPGAGTAAAAAPAAPVETKAEPEAGDETITEDTVVETADAGPAAKASGGSSLFDTPAVDDAPAAKPAPSGGSLFDTPADEPAEPAKPASSGGSLFDLGGDEPEAKAEPKTEPAAKADLGSGGSLFDLAPEAEPDQEAAPEAEEAPKPTAAAAPAADIPSGGSLFDIAAPEPAAPAAEAEPEEEAKPEPTQAAAPTSSIPEGGSLFDIAAPEPTPVVEQRAPASVVETPAAEKQPEPETKAEEPEAKAAPATSIPEGGSLFDIAAPEPTPVVEQRAPASVVETPAAEKQPEAAAVTEPVGEPEPDVPAEAPDGAALSAAATAAASDDPVADEAPEPAAHPEPSRGAEPEPVPEADADPEPEEKPQPAASGDAHQPKTDVDIHGAGSLFDL